MTLGALGEGGYRVDSPLLLLLVPLAGSPAGCARHRAVRARGIDELRGRSVRWLSKRAPGARGALGF
jgi:hypothetical protein